MTRRRRIAGAALLALAATPGTFLRTEIPSLYREEMTISAVEELPDIQSEGGFTREGVWQLASPNIDFGGYSALLVLEDAQVLRAFSDRGNVLTFGLPGSPRAGYVSLTGAWDRGPFNTSLADIESAMRDSAMGTSWLAFENSNTIIRYSTGGALEAARQPPEWADWPENSGAEAMERLPDGRFIVLPERSSTGLLFASDPAEETTSVSFSFSLPGDYAATDLAALPDGRLLVLLRRVSLSYPPFTAALGIADPSGLAEGGALPVELLLDLDNLLPRENYEGLAVQPRDDGSLTLWIIADDNLASFQRTLLAKLRWNPAQNAQEKARED